LPDPAVAALIAKLSSHSFIAPKDERSLAQLHPRRVSVSRMRDLVRQGDRPDASVFVLSGMLARYHTLASGDRQYLSLHIANDLPDIQSLFLQVMDHSLCSLDDAEVAFFSHEELFALLANAPSVTFAFWRQTLLDAAIFRQAITNNGLRRGGERLAHLFCEQFTRAQQAGIAADHSCSFPLTQTQIGQMLGMSLVSVNRAAQRLLKERCAQLRSGKLLVLDWNRLKSRANFDPSYLHLDLHAPEIGRRMRRTSE
jgi:CRP-like cAMP-binding protein